MRSFFIVGVQRSGTTLLSVMLSKHPDIYMEKRSIAFRFITCFENIERLLPYNLSVDPQAFLKWLIENDLDGHLAELLDIEHLADYENIRELLDHSIQQKLDREEKKLWGDKSPNLQHFTGSLLRLIPEAKIIQIIRDGRATANSMHRRADKNVYLAAQEWLEGNISGLSHQQVLGAQQFLMIRYEDLLEKPEQVMQRVCTFLQIDYDPQVIVPEDTALPEEKKYVKSVLDPQKIDLWKTQLSTKEIQGIEAIQGPMLKRFGYALLTPMEAYRHRPMSLGRRILYHQWDNFRQLFRSQRIGMVKREKVVLKISFRSRLYAFVRVFCQEFLSLRIFSRLFSRVFYKEKYFKEAAKKESVAESVEKL
ncbi:MAG: sulfotransferase [Bacteroidota bacterium]